MINFEKKLNKAQLEVVRGGDGYCLVLSGPGSGKTRTLTYRTAYLLERGVDASQIMLLTFTKKAAKEMIERIEKISPGKSEGLYGGTFHHMGNVFLRRYAEKIGYQKNYIILDEEDAKSILSDTVKEQECVKEIKPQVAKKIISLSVNSNESIEIIVGKYFDYFNEDYVAKLKEVAESYKRKKKEANLLDYDDLLFYWNKLLSDKDIANTIAENFLYILVDEYQDTNKLQEEIISKIGSKNQNILVVGDDAQSIYSFRAANIENILSFEKRYRDVKIFKLEKNYRSIPGILNVAENVISKNEKKLEKKLIPTIESSNFPTISSFSNSFQEAEFIADKIENIDNKRDVAILFRAHHHAVELEMELLKRNIEYSLRGGVKFFEKFHVKDALAFLRVLINYKDDSSWKRILTRQEGLGEMSALKIINEIKKRDSLEDVFEKKEDVVVAVSRKAQIGFFQVVDIIRKIASEDGICKKIECLLVNFYDNYLKISFDNAKERINDIRKLSEIAREYDLLEDFVTDLSLSEDFELETETRGGIVLSSIHQAKGLEWDTVFIISLKEGDFPHMKSVEDGMIEEERRLFYVAVTRCKYNLYLSYSSYGIRTKYLSEPSRFLKEMKGDGDFFYDDEVVEDGDGWEFF